jgi:hypothetical protein
LLIFQEGLGKAGKYVADLFSYGNLDPYNAYAWKSVHHITIMLLSLIAILILSRIFKADFGLGLGNRKTGTRFVVIYTVIIAGISLIVHILMMISNSLPVYAFPLKDRKSVV